MNSGKIWTEDFQITFLLNPLNLMALHGFLCLALRHPVTKDHACRPAIVEMVKQIGITLVDLGVLTPEQLTQIEKTEAEARNLKG
jgi:hypothetical protein